jgi:hypothetical protein
MWDVVYRGPAVIVRPDGVQVKVDADLRSSTTGAFDDWMGWVTQTSGHKWPAIDPDAKYFIEFEDRRDSISFVNADRPRRGKRFYLVGLGPRLESAEGLALAS